MILPSQIRAARALIGWRQTDLAAASGVSEISIKNIERSATDPRVSTLDAIVRALEAAGVEFTNGDQPGVRLKADRTYGFIYDDKEIVAKVKDGEVFDAKTGSKIAAVSHGNLVDLQSGEVLGSLAALGITGKKLPAAFRELLS